MGGEDAAELVLDAREPALAGASFGMLNIPRVGHEVLEISFEDADGREEIHVCRSGAT